MEYSLIALAVVLVMAGLPGCGRVDEPREAPGVTASTTASTTAPATTSTTAPSPTTTAASPFALPDLTPLRPYELYVRTNPGTGEREIRFSSQVLNKGDAPLEMRGEDDASTGRTRAFQRLRTPDGEVEERVVGFFLVHPDHRHWHFENFTRVDILAPDAQGEPGEVVASTGKLTSCVRDRVRVSPPVLGSPQEPGYRNCRTDIQGISVGWTDLYEANVPGQQLSIEGLPDGRYFFRFTADPENLLREKDEFNNTTTFPIDISGDAVAIVDRP